MYLEPVDTSCPVPTVTFTVLHLWAYYYGAAKSFTRPLVIEYDHGYADGVCPTKTNFTGFWSEFGHNVRFATLKEIKDDDKRNGPYSYLT